MFLFVFFCILFFFFFTQQRLAWFSWNPIWAKSATKNEEGTVPELTRDIELEAWNIGVRKEIGKQTGLRGIKTSSSSNKYQRFENIFDAETLDALTKCVTFPASASAIDTATIDPLYLKYQLRCVPVLFDIPAVVTHGLSDDIGAYSEPHEIKHSCPNIHPVCGRLAVESILRPFSLHSFSLWSFTQPSSLGISTASHRPAWKQCLKGNWPTNQQHVDGETKRSNCREFSGCWAKAVRRVCGAIPECCPSTESYQSCSIDPSSSGCKNSVCPENRGKVLLRDQ